MTHTKSANPITNKQDFIHLAILLVIALAIGVYLIAETVLISKDGVWYIEHAKKFSSEPQAVIKSLPFGFPLLIFITHKLAALFSSSSSLSIWIYPAQSLTLLCRFLSVIPLYFIGKLLVGSKKSFWAIIILIILPHPAEFGSDILRDWPHILFLASGFLFLIRGAKQGKWWLFTLAGFAAGLGHTIRPECVQLIVYGALWIFIRLISPKLPMSRPGLLCALAALLIGFAIPAAPYTTAKGQFLPRKLKALFSSAGSAESKEIPEPCTRSGTGEPESNSDNSIYPARYSKMLSHGANTASGIPGKIAKGIAELAGAISENLMYYFLPALLVGIYFRFGKKSAAADIERFFIPAFAALNVLMLIALYYKWEYISRRHCLPLVVFTIFYVPVGVEVFAGWLANRFSKSRPPSGKDCRRWSFILLITGIAICLPKLLDRPGSDKPGYRTAAAWLKQNTAPEDLIASPDRRITFYAERKELLYETALPRKADYFVTIVKDQNRAPDLPANAQKQYSTWVNERKKNRKIVIYKMP